MSIEIRLTDQHFPVSPIFVDFLYRHLISDTRSNQWHRQRNEKLTNEAQQILASAQAHSAEVTQHPVAQQTINRSYDLMMSLMFGATERLAALHRKVKFILVTGCPRSGGSYLTRHLFQALGRRVGDVPSVIGHDGFPDPRPFALEGGTNAYTTLTRHMAEYMAMAELFFAKDQLRDGRIIAPKKSTKAAYYGAFFNQALGRETEIIITVRHPTASCISTFEKSGGLPDGKCFQVRSNIESWVERDIEFLTGRKPTAGADYFDCYLQYWENYHYSLVLSGLLANSDTSTVAFGGERVRAVAESFYQRFGTAVDADVFHTQQKKSPQLKWREKGDQAVRRVGAVWQQFGRRFPVDEILENW